jgi:hypothetical protein
VTLDGIISEPRSIDEELVPLSRKAWRTMGKGKRAPEEEEALRRQPARGEQERRDSEMIAERLHARRRAEDERRERGRTVARRLVPVLR